jgi:hypothetical protein
MERGHRVAFLAPGYKGVGATPLGSGNIHLAQTGSPGHPLVLLVGPVPSLTPHATIIL